MADLLAAVRETIRCHGLLKAGEKVVVAVSGGCDSMVLLHLLTRLAEAMNWRLTVAHFNHQLRGAASEADEKLVVHTAERCGLACLCDRADVREHARSHGVSIEMAARKLRHEFLARVTVEAGAGKVALAHHADDQIETFFLRLLRGAGGEALAGMRWAAPSPANPSVLLIRPLLGVPKAALLAYAAEFGVAFREDASNRGLDAQRNVVRRRLVPLVRRFLQPALDTAVPRLMTLLGDEAAFASEAAQRWRSSQRRERFETLHPAVQRQVLRAQLGELGVPLSFELVEDLRCEPNVPVCAPTGLRVWRDDDGGIHPGEIIQLEFDHRRLDLMLSATAGQGQFASLAFRWRLLNRRAGPVARLRPMKWRERFDADQVGQRITLRHWHRGDRFQPIGLAESVKLQDLFANAKVPRAERHTRVVAVAESGELFWVEGFRIGERFKLTPRTRRVFDWRWQAGGRVTLPGQSATSVVASPKRAC